MTDQPRSIVPAAVLMLVGVSNALLSMFDGDFWGSVVWCVFFGIGFVEAREVSIFNEKLDQAESE